MNEEVSEQASQEQSTQQETTTQPEVKVPEIKGGVISSVLAKEKHEPQLILDKFKTQTDLEKAYKELESKVGPLGDLEKKNKEYREKLKAFTGAPEEYTLDNIIKMRSDFIFDGEDPGLKSILNIFKEKGASQELVDTVLDTYASYVISEHQNIIEEVAKVGNDRIQMLDNWCTNNMPPELQEVTKNIIEDSGINGIRIIEWFMENKPKETVHPMPNQNNNMSSNFPSSLEECRRMIVKNHDEYQNDKYFRDSLTAHMNNLQRLGK